MPAAGPDGSPQSAPGPRAGLGPLFVKRIDSRKTEKLKRLVARLDGHSAAFRKRRNPPRPTPQQFQAWLSDNAIHGLGRKFPGESAEKVMTSGQACLGGLTIAGLCICGAKAPLLTLHTVAGVATFFFGFVVLLRIAACINILTHTPAGFRLRTPRTLTDPELPVYTILVPLFREKAVLRGLTQALPQIDYPPGKLDIKLIFESIDGETLAFAKRLRLPGHFEFVVVPDSLPRTKPKALNYALQFARGDFVVVYDAEDRPDPQQLRKALNAFRTGPPNLACLQARLTIYNSANGWLATQFALEYAVLFRGILPTLETLNLPIPLGGTSNHLRGI